MFCLNLGDDSLFLSQCLILLDLYEIHFILHRDGTSIVLSDDVGQIYLLNTGQGESQKDAKLDQVPENFASVTPFLLFCNPSW
jgi:hypothetical protein